MFGFNSTPLNSNYGQVLSTPGQGNNFGNQAAQSSAQGTNPWMSTFDQWYNNANTGAVMPVAGQQASSQQVDQTPFDQTVQNYVQEFPAGSQQGAVQQVATAEAQPNVAQQVAAQPALTDAAWTGENSSGDVIAATQYNQDPYANLPPEVIESIRANPAVGRELINSYEQSLIPYRYRDRQMASGDPYASRAGFGFGSY